MYKDCRDEHIPPSTSVKPHTDFPGTTPNYQIDFQQNRPKLCSSPSIITSQADIRSTFNEVRKWNLHFNGKSDPLAFLERLQELMSYSAISGVDLLPLLSEILQGTALIWYRNDKHSWTMWKDFESAFRNFFLPRDFHFHLEESIAQRRQTQQETGKDYILDLQTLIRRHGNIPESTALMRIYRNLLPDYRQYIRLSDCESISDLLCQVEEYETLQKEIREQKKPPPNRQTQPYQSTVRQTVTENLNQPSQNRNPDPVTWRSNTNSQNQNTNQTSTPNTQSICWRCGQQGHWRQNCHNEPRLFCSVCFRPGILTRNCPCRNQGN